MKDLERRVLLNLFNIMQAALKSAINLLEIPEATKVESHTGRCDNFDQWAEKISEPFSLPNLAKVVEDGQQWMRHPETKLEWMRHPETKLEQTIKELKEEDNAKEIKPKGSESL